MFVRFPTALSIVSLAVLAVATPYPGGNPPPVTVTSTKTSTVIETTTAPPQTITKTATGTCTATAPIVTVTEPASNCTSGPIQCCESIEMANTVPSKVILGLLGVFLKDLDIILGLNCSPVTGVGIGSGNACTAVTVCD